MRIGLDITSLLYHRGVSRYTRNLLVSLLEQPNVNLSLYGSSLRRFAELQNIGDKLIEDFPDSNLLVEPYPPSVISFFWKLGLHKLHPKLPDLDVFHSWDWLQPPDDTLPLVSTIHDLAILKFPEAAHRKVKAMHERSWEVLKSRQSHLITPSRSTKTDIIELLGYPQYLVHIIPEALPREYRELANSLPEERFQQLKNKLKLDRPYVFFVGTREPRKNLVRLIQAWEPLAADVGLIIAGESSWDKTAEFDTDKLTKKGLRFLGRVSDEELVVLYSEAEVFAYPSLYEGFGLPILEAYHAGTPVVTANNSGMSEVAGNAAELVDPLEVESIRSGISKILSESKSEQQKRLQRMIIRLQMYSWNTAASETLKVYRKAVEDFHG